MFTKIEEVIESLNIKIITKERKAILKPLTEFIQSKVSNDQEIRINFICTHNSRRSHLSQVWAQSLAYHFNIQNVFCYSGGTERTALFPMIAETLRSSGFEIKTLSEGHNPFTVLNMLRMNIPSLDFQKSLMMISIQNPNL